MFVLAEPRIFIGVFDGYATFRRGSLIERDEVSAIVRLLCRIELGPEFRGEPCWIVPVRSAYAKVKVDGRDVLAHRLAFIELKGPLPTGHDAHHLCRRGRCINPAHLEPILDAEHARLHRRAQRRSA